MRVLTFNIQSCRAGVDRVADVLRLADADACLLTEVRRRDLGSLAKTLGMHATFGATWRWRPFGNAILTRNHHRRVAHVRFRRTPQRQPRGLVAVRLGSGVTLAVTHLGLAADERLRHAKEIMAALEGVPDPVVLGGDLNDAPSSPPVQLLSRRFRDAVPPVAAEPLFTYPALAAQVRIDYLLSSGLKAKAVATVPMIASDHLAVVADFA